MKELPRLQPIINCVRVRENYRSNGRLQWIYFDPRRGDGHITISREQIPKEYRIVSRIYYDIDDKVILTEVF